MHETEEGRTDYLLDVAADVFLAKGYAATSVGEIAAHAKASKSAFYSRFPTKEKLFTEVFRRRADEAFREFSRIALPDGDPHETLCALGNWLVRCVLSPDSINLLRIVYMESRHIPELGKLYYSLGPERGRAHTSGYLLRLMERGYFRADMDPKLAAEQFHDLLTGELVRRCALSIEPPFTSKEQNYRLNAAVDIFIRAYRA